MINTIHPTQKQLDLINKFNACLKTMQDLIAELPTCRNTSIAFTHLEDVETRALKAILQDMPQDIPEAERPRIMVQ